MPCRRKSSSRDLAGRGFLFGGQVLAYAAMDVGKEVTWIPSYGPEMRGGTANCTVVIADEEIGSPLVEHPPLAVALNLPSFDKYEELLLTGGTLVVNQSMVDRGARRKDIRVLLVPCNQIAEEIGDQKVAEHGGGRCTAGCLAGDRHPGHRKGARKSHAGPAQGPAAQEHSRRSGAATRRGLAQ